MRLYLVINMSLVHVVCVYMRTWVCVRVRVHKSMYACMQVCVCLSVYVYVPVSVCVCVCVCLYLREP